MRRIVLFPFSVVYSVVIFIWDIIWTIRKPQKIDTKVISIGNINIGGTGKTSLAKYLAENLKRKGYKVAIAAKGYKRPGSKTDLICTPDNQNWKIHGDEPVMLCRATGLNVYISENKTRAAQMADREDYDYLIVDDGFQHRDLYRDIDIVCVNHDELLGKASILPGGNLREPLSALKRADILVVFGDNPVSQSSTIREGLPQNIFSAKKTTRGIFNSAGDSVNLQGKKVLAFCGLGNPESFKKSLRETGCRIAEFFTFMDHHNYKSGEIELIMRSFKNTESEYFITTFKDFVKLEILWPMSYPLYYLDIDLKIENESDFLNIIEK